VALWGAERRSPDCLTHPQELPCLITADSARGLELSGPFSFVRALFGCARIVIERSIAGGETDENHN
jgi:hypothetical protein